MKKPLIIVGGPTACGKTAVSISLANAIGGEIISADSMQVYRWMDIGTAKVKQEEMNGINHHLIDILDPDEEFNVMIFQDLAKKAIKEIYDRGRIPIVAGGTGFYINALVRDTDFYEDAVDQSLRKELYELAKNDGAEALHKILEEIDPVSAEKIHPNNIKRVTRAIEFYRLTGARLSEHNAEEKEKQSPYHTAFLVLTMDRKKLYERINLRVDQMMADGLEEEVRGLLNRGYSPDLPSMQGLGYKEMVPFLQGKATYEDTVEAIKLGTRHFAKRQLTWFRRQTEGCWIDMTDKRQTDVLEEILPYLKDRNIIS